MVQARLNFDPPAPRPRKVTLTDKLEAFFRAHPDQFISAVTLADLAGHAGWRQRRLEVEKRGLRLERREWRDADGTHHLAWAYRPSAERTVAA